MNKIEIKNELCTNCNVCVEVCPNSIIMAGTDSQNPSMPAENNEKCIDCGHCEAFCPTEALKHNYEGTLTSPASMGNADISPESLAKYIRNRRSIRRYRENLTVSKEVFDTIFDTIRYAATGMNKQPLEWTVVLDPNKVKALSKATVEWMRQVQNMDTPLKNMIPFEKIISRFDAGNDPINRGAPHLIIVHADKNNPIAAVDAPIAISSLELLLPSFGLGSCWSGYQNIALNFAPNLTSIIGIPESNKVLGVVMVGYPKYKPVRPPKRKPSKITWL